MKMASSAIFSVVLSIVMFSAGAVVDRVTNVYVTNFPFDPQGNIRVTTMNQDGNVTVTNLPIDEQGNLRIKIADRLVERFAASLEIYLIDSSVTGWASQGIRFDQERYGVDFPFTFNPRGRSVNVTDIWVFYVYICGANPPIEFKINGAYAVTLSLPPTDGTPSFYATHIRDTSVYQTLGQGMNSYSLMATSPSTYIDFQKLTILIEYEYLA